MNHACFDIKKCFIIALNEVKLRNTMIVFYEVKTITGIYLLERKILEFSSNRKGKVNIVIGRLLSYCIDREITPVNCYSFIMFQ